MNDSRMLKGNDGSALRFYWGPEKNEARSLEFGRPVFDKVLYLEVISPGQSQSSPVLWLRREYDPDTKLPPQENAGIIERYPAEYAAFMAGDDNRDMTGTPVEQWPAIDVAMAETLRGSRIYTVEALAALPDEKLRLLGMGGRELRARAQAYLDKASGNAGNEAMASRMSSLEEELDRLTAQLAAVKPNDDLVAENERLAARIAELETAALVDDLLGKTEPAAPATEPMVTAATEPAAPAATEPAKTEPAKKQTKV